MTQEEILEGEILIGEFMGGELINEGFTMWFKDTHHTATHAKAINIRALKYHSSWDWLMPVVEKLNIELVPTDINKAYEMVINFIQLPQNTK